MKELVLKVEGTKNQTVNQGSIRFTRPSARLPTVRVGVLNSSGE
jgi:hypothetical protein